MAPSNSFTGTNLNVGNSGIRSVIDEVMHFRTQVTRKDEIRAIGGWKDPLNELLAQGLGRIRKTLAIVTDDPRVAPATEEDSTSSSTGQAARQAEREAQAKDEDARLVDLYREGAPITTDDIQMPSGHKTTLPYDFSGKDINFPQISDAKFENVFLCQFVTVLDMAVKDLSNLASAEHGNTIPDDQSAMIHSRLNQAFTILQEKGGRLNNPIIADGTDPESLEGKVGPEITDVEIPEPVESP